MVQESIDEGNDASALSEREKSKKTLEELFFDKIGGRWGERYSATLVSPSLVPNYFPSLRVFEYNVTGLGGSLSIQNKDRSLNLEELVADRNVDQQSKSGKKHRKAKKPKFITPDPPSKSAPPGPAYSPQTLTWLGYTQHYANLTTINNDFASASTSDQTLKSQGWHEGKHSGQVPHDRKVKPHRKPFVFEVEYDTKTDKVFALKDLTVRSYIDLAARIGKYTSDDGSQPRQIIDPEKPAQAQDKKHKKHKPPKKSKKHKAIPRTWFAFVRRAFVTARDDNDLYDEFSP